MDDVISRKVAIDALDKEYRCTDQSDDWDGLKTAMLIIENLPSAQPDLSEYSDKLWERAYERGKVEAQRKKGKWIIKDNPGTGWYRITCSECGEDVTSTAPCIGFYPNAKVMWDFCPNCGADMTEGEA